MTFPNVGCNLSVVVLNFRTAERTIRAIECLPDASDEFTIETIVVDNGSNDGSAETIRKRFPQMHIVELPTNMGFSAGMNAGIRAASGDFILLLNSDIEAEPGSVVKLIEFMRDNPNVGLTAPLLVDENGKPNRSLLVQPTLSGVFIPLLGKLRYKQWRHRIGVEPLDVEATEGAAVFVKREAVDRAGLLDEGFFFYHEIVEWCMRIRDNGYRVAIVPRAKMKHSRGKSTEEVWLPARIELKRSEYQLLEKRFGRAVRRIAIARDLLLGIARCAFYGILNLAGVRRQVTKLAVHCAVVRWIVVGMPGRATYSYRRQFGQWD